VTSVLTSQDGEVELEGAHLFRMRLIDDMFRKMRRELGYYREAGDIRHASVDHAINFCVTAWHLTDWIWLGYSDYLKSNDMGLKLADFQLWVRESSRELGVCDVIANAVKHGGTAHQKPGRPAVMTLLVTDPVPQGTTLVEFVAANGARPMRLRIMVDGERRHAFVVFQAAVNFWWRFKRRHLLPENSNAELISGSTASST
jgi:hypothetical protein